MPLSLASEAAAYEDDRGSLNGHSGRDVHTCKRVTDCAGYRGRGREWAEEALGAEVEVVNRSPKLTPEKVLRIWAREWFKEGREMD